MASSVSIAQVMQSIAEVGPRGLDDCVSRNSKLFKMIKKVGPSNPNGPTWDAKVGANTSAAATVPGDTLPAADAAEIVKAQLNWANIPASTTFSEQGLKQLELAAMSGLAIYDRMASEIEELGKALAAAVNTGMISGNDTTKDIIGLATAIDDGNTYAGIDRSSKTEWGCYVAANGGSGRTLTVSIMDIAYDYFRNNVYEEAGNWVILSGGAQVAVMRGFSTGASTKTVFAGPDGVIQTLSSTDVMFRNLPVVEIPGYTTGRIDFVNLDALALECLNGAENPFSVSVAKDASSDLTFVKAYFHGQLVLRNPRHNAFSIQDLS